MDMHCTVLQSTVNAGRRGGYIYIYIKYKDLVMMDSGKNITLKHMIKGKILPTFLSNLS
jgi:hypothetical protein